MTTLTFATWNCAHRNAVSALAMLDRFEPSIIALQECSQASSARGDVRYVTSNEQQQVLVTAKTPFRIRNHRTAATSHFLACEVEGPITFNVVAAWTLPPKNSSAYVETLVSAVDSLADFIRAAPTIILGDLNTSYALHGRKYEGLLKNVFFPLQLVSAYHVFKNCEHGAEPDATHRHSSGTTHHLDYCFIPERWGVLLRDVRVEPLADWPGDHAPLVVTLDLLT